MSDNKDKIIGIKIKLSECAHGNLHVTGIEPIRESSVAYSTSDADAVLGGATVGGGSRLYVENWERVFGRQPEPPKALADEDVN